MNKRKHITKILAAAILLLLCLPLHVLRTEAKEAQEIGQLYKEYRQRLDGIQKLAEVEDSGFRVIRGQIFPVTLQKFGTTFLIPAMDTKYNRLILFFMRQNGDIVYRTDYLETNNRDKGLLEQPNKDIAAVSFQDLNKDGLLDIALITTCVNRSGPYAGKPYKVGDVLFQDEDGFYRDYRLSDKINRFGMNQSIDSISAFVKDGNSTEFLYTAATLEELLSQGFQIIEEQCYWRNFEKLGRIRVVPGSYKIADYSIFMLYLVNEQGYIIWSFQPMGEYDNLYALKGINCRDIDGDGLRDIVVLARYSYEGDSGELITKSDYSIYYQRTGGFDEETDLKKVYQCNEDVTMEMLIEKARAYWGWSVEND